MRLQACEGNTETTIRGVNLISISHYHYPVTSGNAGRQQAYKGKLE
jgi:hypothetical protein